MRSKFVSLSLSLSLSLSQCVSEGVRSKFACVDLLRGLAFFEARVPCMAFMALTSGRGGKRKKSCIRTYVFRGSGALYGFSGSHICRSVDNQLYFCTSTASKLRSGFMACGPHICRCYENQLLMYEAFSY